ncbi:GTP pyrophosphokinase [Stieleria mannarensis]|uniref:GTP pyrophosphokinase n=1 Tax=Stieleria mannarensis TaxID=2755585 RepID=UPI0016025BAC|nr:GTP pyrophosphokinase [Rhodopirellula sp. JC639]
MSATLEDAIALAATHFAGVTDKSGQPYLLHCIRVMMGVDDLEAKMVGVMHDLVEDTAVTLDDLRSAGFSAAVVRGVDLMTHRSEVSYADYVVGLKPHDLARQVKLSDLRDNMSPDRVLLRDEKFSSDLGRVGKYISTYRFLTDQFDEVTYRKLMSQTESI